MNRPTPAGAASDRAPWWRWLGEGRWQAAVLVLTAIVGFISWAHRLQDFGGYLLVGRAVLSGADIYRDTPPGINTWPPFFSVASVPLALISLVSTYLATSLWVLINFAVLLLSLDLISRMLHGRPMTLRRRGPGLSITSAELFVPLVLTSTYIFNNFELLQINLLLFGMTLGGMYLIQTGRTVQGAVAVGTAAALKVQPVVFLPYLFFRRSWRALGYATLVTAGLSLSPILVFGWDRYWYYVATWRRVLGYGWGVGASNQSVFAMWDRIIGHGMIPFLERVDHNFPASGEREVTIAWALTMLLIVLTAWRQFRIGPAALPRVVLTEWSVVFIVSALYGPVAWKAYFVVLLLPNALLYAIWRRPDLEQRGRRTVGWVLFCSVLLSFLSARDLIGIALFQRLQLGSVATLSALVMLGGLLWLRGRPDLLQEPISGPDRLGKVA